MDQHEIEVRIKNIDDRTTRIEQILPTLAAKDDLKAFATKDDLKPLATQDQVREEGARTRAHFNAVAERIEARVKVIAESHEATKAHVDAQLTEVKTDLAAHDRRIMKLEAESLKRR